MLMWEESPTPKRSEFAAKDRQRRWRRTGVGVWKFTKTQIVKKSEAVTY